MVHRIEPEYETTLYIDGEPRDILYFNDEDFEHAESVFREDSDVAEAMNKSEDISIHFSFAGMEEWDE